MLQSLSLLIERGKITALAGPNGCGKSTLLRAIRRLHKPSSGGVILEEIDISPVGDKVLARQIVLLAQSPSAPGDMTVEDWCGWAAIRINRCCSRGAVAMLQRSKAPWRTQA